MAAVWIILAKTRFPAELIESSREHGVVSVSVPFDISADFIPDLLRRPDRKLEKLAVGLSIEAPEFEDIICRGDVMKRIIQYKTSVEKIYSSKESKLKKSYESSKLKNYTVPSNEQLIKLVFLLQ